MSNEATTIRLATKLSDLTKAGKLEWADGGAVWQGGNSGFSYRTSVDEQTTAFIGEVPLPRSSINSYSFSIREDGNEVFDVFAEGIPAEPTEEQREMWRTLKELFYVARDSARGTKQKVERFEELLGKLA